MNRSFLTAAGVALLFTAVVDSQNAAPDRLRAGAHKIDFTPKESELPVSGKIVATAIRLMRVAGQ